jgi:hypothetical protein
MIELKVSIAENDKYIAGMARALAYWSAPNERIGQASVKGSKLESGIIVLHFNTDAHLSEFKKALDKYLRGSASILN